MIVGLRGAPMGRPVRLERRSIAEPQRRCGPAQAASGEGKPTDSGSEDGPSSSSSSDNGSAPTSKGAKQIKLPTRGYFALADPKAEVYSRAGEKFDPTKKGGRYKPEFIWNTDWQKALEMEESFKRQEERAREQAAAGPSSDPQPGAISFSRLADLNSMDVDLTEQLLRKKPKQPEQPPQKKKPKPAVRTVMPTVMPSRSNSRKLERVSRINNALAVSVVTSDRDEDQKELERKAKEELEKYEQQKVVFQGVTLALGWVGALSTFSLYGQNVCASYVVGAVGGYVYLRLLGKGVDAVGAKSIEGAAKSVSSQPRLFIPAILGLVYNRWNVLYAENTGVELELLPMLVGFFTYKIAVIAVEARQLLMDMSIKPKEE